LRALKLEAAKEEMTRVENERLQKVLEETNDKISKLNTDLIQKEREQKTLESEVREEKEANAKLAREAKEKSDIIKEKTQEIEEKEDEERRLKKMIGEKTSELEGLQEAKDKVEDELKIKTERVEELGAALDSRANDMGSAQAIFVGEEKKQAHLMRELDKAKLRIAELEREVDRLRAELKKKERRRSTTSRKDGEALSIINKKDIKMIIKYIDGINDSDDGEVSIEEFEKAMRMSRRAKGCAEEFSR